MSMEEIKEKGSERENHEEKPLGHVSVEMSKTAPNEVSGNKEGDDSNLEKFDSIQNPSKERGNGEEKSLGDIPTNSIQYVEPKERSNEKEAEEYEIVENPSDEVETEEFEIVENPSDEEEAEEYEIIENPSDKKKSDSMEIGNEEISLGLDTLGSSKTETKEIEDYERSEDGQGDVEDPISDEQEDVEDHLSDEQDDVETPLSDDDEFSDDEEGVIELTEEDLKEVERLEREGYYEGLDDDVLGGYVLGKCDLGDRSREVDSEWISQLYEDTSSTTCLSNVLNPFGKRRLLELKSDRRAVDMPLQVVEKQIIYEKVNRKPREIIRCFKFWKTAPEFKHIVTPLALGAISKERTDEFYFYYDYYKRGDLGSMVEKRGGLFEFEARNYFLSMCAAVQELHENGISHGGISPANFLLCDDYEEKDVFEVKLRDLEGMTLKGENDDHYDSFRTRNLFKAPEVDKSIVNISEYDTKAADIWSLGASLLYILSTVRMLGREERSKMFRYDAESVIGESPMCLFSNELKKLLKNMLNFSPSRRMNIQEILEHPWVTETEQVKNLLEKNNVRIAEAKKGKNGSCKYGTIMFDYLVENFEVVNNDSDFKRVVCQKIRNEHCFDDALDTFNSAWMKKIGERERKKKMKKAKKTLGGFAVGLGIGALAYAGTVFLKRSSLKTSQ